MNRRNTIQKELILAAVRRMRRHITADDVYEYVSREYPSIGKGTVYRNLNILSEEQKIRKIEIPNGADHFDFNTVKHYHMRCNGCGALFDVDMDEITGFEKLIRDTRGMLFLDHEILFKGICVECQGERSDQCNG